MMTRPKLRFPKFSGEWPKVKLGKLLKFKNGVNASKKQYGKGIKFINVLDIIRNNFITYGNIIGSVDISSDVFKKNEVAYGDILFQRSSETREEVGQSNVYLDENMKATFGGFVIRGQKISEYEPVFMNCLLKTNLVRKDITSRSGGSTRYNIGQDSLEQVSIFIPSEIEEQKKIAEFLTEIDNKIQKLTQKKEALSQYKKGLLQKLFPKAGEMVTELRFSGFNIDWKEKKIGDIFDQRSEKGYEDLELLSVTINFGVKKRQDIESKDNSSNDKSNYRRVVKNDIVYNSMRMWQGASGISKFDGIVSPAYTVLKGNKSNSSTFFSYYFKIKRVIFIFQRSSQGATSDTWNLKYPQLSSIKLMVPELSEQQKIADLLTEVDKKINQVDQQIETMTQFKKGLLRQMFV